MFTATKTETEILKILNSTVPIEKEDLIEELCKSSVIAQQAENALEGCIIKGFAVVTNSGKIKITESGKKQI